MPLSDIRAAVAGVGFIGVAHVEALRRLGVDVVGVVGSSPERARIKAAAANLPRVYESYDELVGDPQVDVVHVATPNYAHADQVRRAFESNKHVVCEKPLAMTSDETNDLLERAEARGLVHAVCYNIRFYPLCHEMRALVGSGAIGEPRFVTGSYLQDWLLQPTDWNWRLVRQEAGELRAVADIGTHWLDLARFITGRDVVEVMAELHTFVPVRRHPRGPVETFAAAADDQDLIEEKMSSDDAAGIMLRFDDGTRGVVAVSQVSAGRKNSVAIEVDGSESALSWFSEDPDRLWIGHRGRPNEILQRDPSLVHGDARRTIAYPAGHVEGYPDTFRSLFAEVYADVERGRPSQQPTYPTFADGHDALCVLDAITLSAAEQSWAAVKR
jgi:predicted dehydrogenase